MNGLPIGPALVGANDQHGIEIEALFVGSTPPQLAYPFLMPIFGSGRWRICPWAW